VSHYQLPDGDGLEVLRGQRRPVDARTAAKQRSIMRKLVFLCRRRPDITHEDFAGLVLTGHVPLALRHHPTMRRYVVNIVDRIQIPGSREIDSVAELSFDSLQDYRERLYDSKEGEGIIARDVARFMGGADAYETTEHVHRKPEGWRVGRTTPGIKMIAAVKRNPSLSHGEFVEHWLGRHVPLALEHHAGLIHYVTNVVDSRLSPTGDDLDGIAELGFASERDLAERLYGSAEGRRVVEEDIPRFLGPMWAWIATEHPQK
jgi:hypothetical protein